MNEILRNMALIELNKFVREHNIDTGTKGTYVVKDGRGFTYSLRDAGKGKRIASVTFHKSQVPTFSVDISTVLEVVGVDYIRAARETFDARRANEQLAT